DAHAPTLSPVCDILGSAHRRPASAASAWAWKTGGMRLLVAALDAELSAFPETLPGFDRLVTGPGKLQAAVALTRALTARDYEEIVVVGSAGAVDDELEASVFEVSATIQHDVTDIDGIVGQHVSRPSRLELAP